METAISALTFIVPQISILSDELRKKCEGWLFLLAEKIAANNTATKKRIITDEMVDDGYKLLEIALTLSFRTQDAQTSGGKFKELMLGLLNIWRELGAITETAIANMSFSLPLKQTNHLSEILLSIRASKPQDLVFEKSTKQQDVEDED